MSTPRRAIGGRPPPSHGSHNSGNHNSSATSTAKGKAFFFENPHATYFLIATLVIFLLLSFLSRWGDLYSRQYPSLVIENVLSFMEQTQHLTQEAKNITQPYTLKTLTSAYTSATTGVAMLNAARSLLHDQDIQKLTHKDPLHMSEEIATLQNQLQQGIINFIPPRPPAPVITAETTTSATVSKPPILTSTLKRPTTRPQPTYEPTSSFGRHY